MGKFINRINDIIDTIIDGCIILYFGNNKIHIANKGSKQNLLNLCFVKSSIMDSLNVIYSFKRKKYVINVYINGLKNKYDITS
tara:strand:+ start:748 stop:996 length:249 start_codon:yes stop_codon:yes gene_type:complete